MARNVLAHRCTYSCTSSAAFFNQSTMSDITRGSGPPRRPRQSQLGGAPTFDLVSESRRSFEVQIHRRRLNQRAGGSQKSLLVSVEDRDERHLGQIQSLPQQVDTDQHVELAPAEIPENLDPLQRLDVRVQVPHPYAELLIVLRQVLGHPF